MSDSDKPLSKQDLAAFDALKTKRLRGPKAMRQLRLWGDQGVRLLAALLHTDDAKTRTWAVTMLGNIYITTAVPVLITALNDSNPGVQLAAVRALAAYAPDAVDALLSALPTAPDRQRSGIIQALGELADPRAFPGLQTQITHPNPDIRALTARALGQIGDVRAVSMLFPLLNDEAWGVRFSVIDALGILGDVQAVPPLLHLLQTETDADLWLACIAALEQIGEPQSAESLTAHLTHPNATIRARIAQALGVMHHQQAVLPLLNLVHDDTIADLGNPLPVQVHVIIALGQLKHPHAIAAISEILRNSSHPDTRWAAAVALGMIGDPRAQFALEEAHIHDDEEVSWGGETVADAAAQALAKLNTP